MLEKKREAQWLHHVTEKFTESEKTCVTFSKEVIVLELSRVQLRLAVELLQEMNVTDANCGVFADLFEGLELCFALAEADLGTQKKERFDDLMRPLVNEADVSGSNGKPRLLAPAQNHLPHFANAIVSLVLTVAVEEYKLSSVTHSIEVGRCSSRGCAFSGTPGCIF